MTITEYINAIEEPRKSEVKALHKLIKETVPKLKPFFLEMGMGKFIGYGKYAYETKSGCMGDWFVIGLANQKHYISLYACGLENGKYIAEQYKKKLPKANIGRSCIRFKRMSDVDHTVLKEILKRTEKSDKLGV